MEFQLIQSGGLTIKMGVVASELLADLPLSIMVTRISMLNSDVVQNLTNVGRSRPYWGLISPLLVGFKSMTTFQ